jgi:hypothetical protein
MTCVARGIANALIWASDHGADASFRFYRVQRNFAATAPNRI